MDIHDDRTNQSATAREERLPGNLNVDAGSIPAQATNHNSSNQCQFPYVETGTSFTGLPLIIIFIAT